MTRWWTGLVGSVVEAWSELRIHRTRVLMSLIGVGVAVAALTTVVAGGAIVEQSQVEQYERSSGRPALVVVTAYDPVTGGAPAAEDLGQAFSTAAERYSITWTSRVYNTGTQVQTPYGVLESSMLLVDADYGTMHRVSLAEGEWFTDRDELRLAPAVIINEYLWNQLGSPALQTHPTLDLLSGEQPVTGVIVGITPSSIYDTWPTVTALYSAVDRLVANSERQYVSPSLEMWVPPEIAEPLQEAVRRDIAGALGDDIQVDAYRQDYQTLSLIHI